MKAVMVKTTTDIKVDLLYIQQRQEKDKDMKNIGYFKSPTFE